MNIDNAMDTRDLEKGLIPPVLSMLEFQQLLARYKRAVYSQWVYPSFESDSDSMGAYDLLESTR